MFLDEPGAWGAQTQRRTESCRFPGRSNKCTPRGRRFESVRGLSPKAPHRGCCTKPRSGAFYVLRWPAGIAFGPTRGSRSGEAAASGRQRFRDRRLRVCEAGAPEFEQVVGGCYQLPLGLAGGEAASEEAVAAPDHLRVREDGFDDLLASPIESPSFGRREHRLDPLCFLSLAR